MPNKITLQQLRDLANVVAELLARDAYIVNDSPTRTASLVVRNAATGITEDVVGAGLMAYDDLNVMVLGYILGIKAAQANLAPLVSNTDLCECGHSRMQHHHIGDDTYAECKAQGWAQPCVCIAFFSQRLARKA